MDFVQMCREQEEWSRATFGDKPTVHSVIAHLEKEIGELKADPMDPKEWADVIILGIEGMLRAGYPPESVENAIRRKMAINRARKWPDPATIADGEPIEHLREDV